MEKPTAETDLRQQDGEREPHTLDCEVNQTAIQRPSTHAHLRHASLGPGDVDIHTLSRQMGTSVAMLERHYSKLTATMAAARLW